MNELYIGMGAMAVSIATVSAPVLAIKVVRMKKALESHGIVYCVVCNEYKLGKHQMCNSCIQKAASAPTEIVRVAPDLEAIKTGIISTVEGREALEDSKLTPGKILSALSKIAGGINTDKKPGTVGDAGKSG